MMTYAVCHSVCQARLHVVGISPLLCLCTAGSGLSYNPFSTRSDPVLMQRSRTAYAQMEHEAAEAAAAQAPMLAPVYDDDEYEHYSRRPGAGGDEPGLSDPVGCQMIRRLASWCRCHVTCPQSARCAVALTEASQSHGRC
jgi:hypothetical protein